MMRRGRIPQILLLATITVMAVATTSTRAVADNSQVILIRISSSIDYRTADLIANAATDVQQGSAAKLLLELDADSGYYAPSMQLVDLLSSIRTRVVAYIGPSGAVSESFSAFIAMSSGFLAMNSGTSIGNAGAGVVDSENANYLAGLMGSLAVMNGRNAPAAAAMVTRNVEYSAEDAYSKGVCDLEVDSFNSLLSTLKVDPASIVERTLSQYPSMNNSAGYDLVKFLADPFVLKSLFILCGFLVMLNLAMVLAKPHRSKLDEANHALLELIRMEVLSSDLYRVPPDQHQIENLTYTPPSAPTIPPVRMSRVPTPTSSSGKRLEKPMEVRKR
jgi:membrane-bound ClpP family serine protease